MTLAEIQDADLGRIIADAGNVFTYNGVEYACIIADLVNRKPLDDGGFMQEYDLAITTRANLLQDTIGPGARVTVGGAVYRVENVRKNFTGAIIVLNLMAVDK